MPTFGLATVSEYVVSVGVVGTESQSVPKSLVLGFQCRPLAILHRYQIGERIVVVAGRNLLDLTSPVATHITVRARRWFITRHTFLAKADDHN